MWFPRADTLVVITPVTNGDATAFATGESSSNAIPVTDDSAAELELDVDDLFKASSAICIEKQNAASAVGSIFVATKRHFLPYVEPTTLELLNMLPHFSDGVRKSAIDSLFSIIQVFYQLSEAQEWEAGLPTVRAYLHKWDGGVLTWRYRKYLFTKTCATW